MAKFCPECGQATVSKDIGGRLRDCCPNGHFTQFANTPVSVAALVLKDRRVLLVQHNHPSKVWSLPGGYVEQEEDLASSVMREVKEECQVDINPIGIIAMRQLVKETRNELYIIFLAELVVDVEPHGANDEEILDARFVMLDDVPDWNITPLSRRIVADYLAHHPKPMTSFSIEDYMPNAYMWHNM